MSPRLRPSVLTAGFAVLFAVIANLAWATAIATTGPWFDAGTGLAVYSVALVLATVLVVFLVQQATARISRLDASLVRLDRRIALLRAAPRGRMFRQSSREIFRRCRPVRSKHPSSSRASTS